MDNVCFLAYSNRQQYVEYSPQLKHVMAEMAKRLSYLIVWLRFTTM